MKTQEILGALRDLVDRMSQDSHEDVAVNVFPSDMKQRFVPVNVSVTPEVTPQKDKETPLNTMVPPLQQKIELLKRAVDIDNVFDGTSVDQLDNDDNELSIIKKNAGLNPVALDALGDDEPLDV
jgi:hypothetical protein